MVNSIQQHSAGKSRKSARQDVQSELNAIETAFNRVSKNSTATIRFLSKAGIVTKGGRLAKEYRS
jgi:hypothetical protein